MPNANADASASDEERRPHRRATSPGGDAPPSSSSSSRTAIASTSSQEAATTARDPEKADRKSEDDSSVTGLKAVLLIMVCCSAQMVGQLQVGGSIIVSAQIGRALGTTDPGEWSWIPASYSLTAGIFVLFFGRMADIYGQKLFFVFGFICNAVFNLASGFVSSPVPFDVLRGLAGIGTAAMLPSAVAVLGQTFAAGSPARTVSFCIFGALAPIGAVMGGAAWSLIVEMTTFRWAFWSLAIFCAVMTALAVVIIPNGKGDANARMDWVGALLGLSGMILFNFVWNQGPLAGWTTPYIYALLVVSLLLIILFGLWNKRQGEKALLPPQMFANKEVPLVLLALWFGWMSFGIFLYYLVTFLRDIRGFEQPLSVVAQMSPLVPCGAGAALALIWIAPRVDGHWIFAVAMFCFFLGDLLISLAPVQQTYWAMIFPAVLLVPFGPDFSFASGQLIISNSVGKENQGSAGGLCLTIVNYSISIGLGMAGTIERYVGHNGEDELAGIRAALYFGAGLAFTAFLIVVLFVRIDSKPDRH